MTVPNAYNEEAVVAIEIAHPYPPVAWHLMLEAGFCVLAFDPRSRWRI